MVGVSMHIYEDARTVSRADLAGWLRQLAHQLESGGQIFYGAAGAVSVADEVRCELEIERESDTEVSVEIEFSWHSPKPVEPVATSAEAEDAEEDAEAEDVEADEATEEDEGDAATEEVKQEAEPADATEETDEATEEATEEKPAAVAKVGEAGNPSDADTTSAKGRGRRKG